MTSVRLLIGVSIVLLIGSAAAVPAAGSTQSDQVTLTVTVVDQNGATVGGVPISVTWADGDGGPVNATTASNGQALVDVPRGANVSIAVDDDDWIRNRPLRVEDASEQSVEVDVSPTASATITITDSNGQAVPNTRVLLFRGGNFITDQRTASDGSVTTPDVEEGDYDIFVRKSGYYYNRTDVTLDGATTVNRSIREGSVGVTFSVTDTHFDPAEPVQGATVDIPSIGTVQTLSNGEATINLPVNSEHDIDVRKAEYRTTEQSISVGESQKTIGVNVSRTPRLVVDAPNRTIIGESISLEVTDEYDEPVAGANVTRDGEAVGMTDDTGEIDVTVDTAGQVNYTIEARDNSTTVSIEVFDPEATDAPGGETDEDPSFGSGPGFTPVTVVAALALLSVFALRRRRR